jgi:hypothetical protein
LIRGVGRALLFLMGGACVARAQTLVVRDYGPGGGPQLLAQILRSPYTVVPPATGDHTVAKDSAYSRTLIVLARKVFVEGTVHGDLIVIGGDLYMHPGGRIDGRAIAFGGGVYESMLATIGQGLSAFRDFTYDVAPIPGGFALSYRALGATHHERALKLAGIYGLLIPSYDRSNGLSLPIGITARVPGTGLRLDPTATYRSQLGRLDARIAFTDSLRDGFGIGGSFGRSTFSNDEWIRSGWINSLHVLSSGNDTRNYFRATRGEGMLTWRSDSSSTTVATYAGVRGEHALTVRPGSNATGGPWSFVGRHGLDDMLRPNPRIDNGTIVSGIAGAAFDWTVNDLLARAQFDVEAGSLDPDAVFGIGSTDDRHFAQLTFDGSISFNTFGTQTLRFDGHAVLTTHGQSPRQRWAYLGGPGTLPPLELLELGGDQLVFVDGRYNIPLDRLQLPIVGAPLVTLRDAIGGAAVGEWPTIHQAVGARLSLSVIFLEFMADPATKRGHFDFGFSLLR